MTVIMQGGLQYQNTVDLKGPVASAKREEAQSPSQSPNAYHTETVFKFDDHERLVERTNDNSIGGSTTTNVWVNGRLSRAKSGPSSTQWQIARFELERVGRNGATDKDGYLSEFKAGHNKEEMNDYVNFKYDSAGHCRGYEMYAETLTEISYVGNRITLSRLQKFQRRKFFEQVQIVDDKKRVVDLRVSDLSGNKLKLWYHVTFKYDDKDRVIEQDTEPFKVGSGDDYSPMPGKLIVEYHDQKHSGDQKFYDTEGKLALHTTFEFDHDGVFTKLRVLDTSGKEQMGGEIFHDPQSSKLITRPGQVEWEVVYDDHGNWTERRRWFMPADGSPRIMTRAIRQEINYR